MPGGDSRMIERLQYESVWPSIFLSEHSKSDQIPQVAPLSDLRLFRIKVPTRHCTRSAYAKPKPIPTYLSILL